MNDSIDDKLAMIGPNPDLYDCSCYKCVFSTYLIDDGELKLYCEIAGRNVDFHYGCMHRLVIE